MKRLLIASAILGLSATAAYATEPGLYVGGQFGYADTGTASDMKDFGLSTHTDHLGGRIFAGYQFNPYVALEAGYTRYSDVTGKASGSVPVFNPDGTVSTLTVTDKLTAKEQSADLVGVLMYPLDNGFSVYAKGGVAYVNLKAEFEENGSVNGTPAYSLHADGTAKYYRPTVGAGINYDINQNLSAKIDYTFIDKNSEIPNIHFVSVGLAYHFA